MQSDPPHSEPPAAPEPGAAAPPQPPANPPAKQEKKTGKEGLWDTLRFILIVFGAALILRTFIIAPFSIPSGSMLPRLMIGDYLFVAKWPYGYSRYSMPFGIGGFDGRILGALPERGDVVVFRYPGPGNEDYVKRVIGLPGDTVQVRSGQLILNGQPVPRHRIADYLMLVSANSPCRAAGGGAGNEIVDAEGDRHCVYPRYREILPGGASYDVLDQFPDGPGDNTPVFQVPQGQVFVMGDNRDDSLDSRFTVEEQGVGLLPIENILGRAMINFFSTDGSAEWIQPWTWFSAARWDRIGS
ncbi:signal peptidase I, partial [Allosphingosinicella sp.]|uniref:signal peptidase I n=1 Tax=Allosphingosinicella sp. TaxID=2823234 RepID=UPI002EFF9018